MSLKRITLSGGPDDGREIELQPGVLTVVVTRLKERPEPIEFVGMDKHGPIFKPLGIVNGHYQVNRCEGVALWQGWDEER